MLFFYIFAVLSLLFALCEEKTSKASACCYMVTILAIAALIITGNAVL